MVDIVLTLTEEQIRNLLKLAHNLQELASLSSPLQRYLIVHELIDDKLERYLDNRIQKKATFSRRDSGVDPSLVMWRDKLRYAQPEIVDNDGVEKVRSITLVREVLGLDVDRLDSRIGQRLRACMLNLGWRGPFNMWIDGKQGKGYIRLPAHLRQPVP